MPRGNGASSIPAWKQRLTLLFEEVSALTEECKQTSNKESIRKLHILNERFIKETHIYIEKLEEDDVIRYTNKQMEAELLSSPSPSSSRPEGEPVHSKLPKLELVKYSGDILKWSEFWDRFSASVDCRSLRDADKLSYLQSSLVGEARATIQGLDSTNGNYPIALQLLKDRYGKPGLVLDAHYKALTNLKRASSTPKECLDTYNEIERHLRILKSMGEDVNHNHLRTIILSKFPDDLMHELKSKIKPEEESVDNIRRQLEHIITARLPNHEPPKTDFLTTEALHVNEFRRNIPRRNGKRPPKRKFTPTSQKGTPALSTHAGKRRKIDPCIFCSGNHYNDQCSKSLDERKSLLKGRCYKCFSKEHIAQKCKRQRKCYHCKSESHNSALCTKGRTDVKTKVMHTKEDSPCTTVLQTAIIEVQENSGRKQKLRAVLDTGSQRSYITVEAARRLNLDILEDSQLLIYTFGSLTPKELNSPIAEIRIKGPTTPIRMKVNIIPHITEDIDPPDITLCKQLPANSLARLGDDGSLGKRIDILIGNDYYYSFLLNEKLRINEHLYLVNSIFGWIWSGMQGEPKNEDVQVITYMQRETPMMPSPDLPLKDITVLKLWDIETIGINDCPKTTNDDVAVEKFHKSVKFENGRYWINWPWKQNPNDLPDNYGLAYGRLVGLLKRIDQPTLQEYDRIIKKQIENHILEEIDGEKHTGGRIHYLPHHYVKKGVNMRLVYDGSSKEKGSISLNECLYKGPMLLENLIGLILRFRSHKYGILADVEKAFLQIGIQTEDRDVTRSLWLKDIRKGATKDNLLYLRFCRVPFGIVCSPFLLAITIKHHLQTLNTPLCRKIEQEIYVDNLVSGGDTTNECMEIFKETKSAFNSLSMNMREWNSNNQFLMKKANENRTPGDNVAILGINWNMQKDHLSLKKLTTATTNAAMMTKRKVLGQIATVFDPCGYCAPLLLQPKIFLQTLWIRKLDWDVILPLDLQNQWIAIDAQLKEINNIKVERWYGIDRPLNDEGSKVEIHCFTDASTNAYAATVYLKVVDTNRTRISLVISRTRLTPIKARPTYTIPRLELLGVLIGCRLIKFVTTHLPFTITNTYLWTDSQIVIQWIKTNRVLPPFVSARIMEINKFKNVEFKNVPTDQNPADLATRPCKNLETYKLWFEGPEFLGIPENSWPSDIVHERVLTTRIDDKEIQVIKELQKQCFPAETAGKVTDLARNLGLFMDEGVLRCRGRFRMTDWPENQKYPILLPKDNDFTRNIIEETHKRLYHVGVNQTLANVRLDFWIPHGRSQVQKVIRHCKECRKYGGGPYKRPPMPPLPKERVNISTPFTYTGTDYLGPLYVAKDGRIEKRWICLDTCLAIRAVHLEVVESLSAEECLLSMRRFIATRGMPYVMLSDNATCFKLTADVMESDYCIKNKIKWKFIPELAPWFGGTYERLVGLTKMCLKRTIDKHTLNDSQLKTVIKEIEAVLNCRPLTTVGQELEHVLTPNDFLRPGGLSSSPEVSDEVFLEPGTDIKTSLIEGWKKGQDILEEFRKMFTNLYLVGLRERATNRKEPRITEKSLPQVGDIVQIKDEGKSRTKWKVGKIEKLIRSEDKEIRVAIVKLPDGEQLRRSVTHLYPLEIYNEEEADKSLEKGLCNDRQATGKETEMKERDGTFTTEEEVVVDATSNERPKRKALKDAKAKINEWTKLLYAN